MATITVTAKDSTSAMEDVFEQLGEDAYIIETMKKNGKVSMMATNDSILTKETHRPSVKAFSKIFDSKMIDTNPSPKKAFAEIMSTQDALSAKNNSTSSKSEPSNWTRPLSSTVIVDAAVTAGTMSFTAF